MAEKKRLEAKAAKKAAYKAARLTPSCYMASPDPAPLHQLPAVDGTSGSRML